MAENTGSSESSETGRKEVTFQEFIFMLSSQALIQMGDVPNPLTQKLEVNLPAARHFIETLAMIERKTKGNLTSDEERAISEVLYNLRMRYVEAVKK